MTTIESDMPRAGLVGLGAHATDVLLPALRAAGFRVTAVCARTPGAAREAALRHGVDRAHNSVATLCEDETVDALVIAVPPPSVESVLDVALRTGKPVYVEKPGAPDVATARRLVEVAREFLTATMVGYMKRFAPAYVALNQRVASGEVGPLSLVRVRWAMGPFSKRRGLDDWFIENAVHGVDLLRWLAGPIAVLQAQVTELDGQHVVLATGATQDNVAVSLTACTTGPWWSDNEEVEVFGMGSTGRVRNVVEGVHITMDGVERRETPNFTIPVPRNDSLVLTGFVPALQAFRDVVGGQPSPCDLAEATRTLELADDLIAAAVAS